MLIFCAAGTSAATYGGVAEPTLRWGVWNCKVEGSKFKLGGGVDLDFGLWSLGFKLLLR